MSAEANVCWKVGETWRIDATMHDSLNAPLDLTGATVFWRLTNSRGVILQTLSIGSGIVLVNGGIDGECIITTTPAMQSSMGIVPGVYPHEAQVILPDGTYTDQFAGFIQASSSLFPLP